MHFGGTIFTRLGKQFNTELVQLVKKNGSCQSRDAVNIQKRFKTEVRPNLYLASKKEAKFYHVPEKIGFYQYLLLSIPIGTFLLGTWQVQRRKWKLNLLETINSRVHHEPLDLLSNLQQLEEMEYYPFKVKGTFLYDKEFVIGPRSLIVNGASSTSQNSSMKYLESQRGYYVITPFKLSNEDLTILVNRGWVPDTLKTTKAREYTQIKGEFEIVGTLRLNETRPQFVPRNSPQKCLWYYRDVNAMALITDSAPIFLDMKRDPKFMKYPIGSQTKVVLRNEHLSYIFTWYSLSVATLFMWYRKFIKKVPV